MKAIVWHEFKNVKRKIMDGNYRHRNWNANKCRVRRDDWGLHCIILPILKVIKILIFVISIILIKDSMKYINYVSLVYREMDRLY